MKSWKQGWNGGELVNRMAFFRVGSLLVGVLEWGLGVGLGLVVWGLLMALPAGEAKDGDGRSWDCMVWI